MGENDNETLSLSVYLSEVRLIVCA